MRDYEMLWAVDMRVKLEPYKIRLRKSDDAPACRNLSVVPWAQKHRILLVSKSITDYSISTSWPPIWYVKQIKETGWI